MGFFHSICKLNEDEVLLLNMRPLFLLMENICFILYWCQLIFLESHSLDG